MLSKAVATPQLMRKSGAFLGVVRKALDDYDDEALHRMHLWDGGGRRGLPRRAPRERRS